MKTTPANGMPMRSNRRRRRWRSSNGSTPISMTWLPTAIRPPDRPNQRRPGRVAARPAGLPRYPLKTLTRHARAGLCDEMRPKHWLRLAAGALSCRRSQLPALSAERQATADAEPGGLLEQGVAQRDVAEAEAAMPEQVGLTRALAARL